MIFVLGGAYQGKKSFAKREICQENRTKWLDCSSLNKLSQEIVEAYPEDKRLSEIVNLWIQEGNYSTIVIDKVESSIRQTKTLEEIEGVMNELIILDKNAKREGIELVLIGTQIGSGVVPIDPIQRVYRDNVGFLFQRIARQAKEVYRIWAGLPEKLK
jgi:adenosyl cobinamide kinase/adenosyl cobinamide phosphate guanylyltransferase